MMDAGDQAVIKRARYGFASMSSPVKEMDSAGNGKFTKSKSRGRIDASVAAVMALGRASAGNASGPSPYTEERGFLFL